MSEAKNNYEFTKDLISYKVSRLIPALSEFIGKKEVKYLEVGVFEGRTLIWMFENILKEPSCRATVIDCFTDKTQSAFYKNIKIAGLSDRVNILEDISRRALHTLPLESFDFIYIDGAHSSLDVLGDAVQAWLLLKEGGVMIFDDYGLEDDRPRKFKPKLALDVFLEIYSGELEIISKDYDVIVRKTKPFPRFSTPLGENTFYCWGTNRVYLKSPVRQLPFTQAELIQLRETLYSFEERLFETRQLPDSVLEKFQLTK